MSFTTRNGTRGARQPGGHTDRELPIIRLTPRAEAGQA